MEKQQHVLGFRYGGLLGHHLRRGGELTPVRDVKARGHGGSLSVMPSSKNALAGTTDQLESD
ncbi:hypothetical protein D9M72_111240 [compost metagenome]